MTTRHTSHHPARSAALSLAWALAAGFVIVGSASADVLPLDEEACQSLEVGAACMTRGEGPGTCMESQCARLDYAHWDRDASMTPPSIMYDCRRCVVIADGSTGDGGPRMTPDAPPPGGACSVGHAGAHGSWPVFALAGLAMAALRRRRR